MSVPARKDWPTFDQRPVGRDELLEDRRCGTIAERDERARDERPVRVSPASPPDDDRPGEPDPGGDIEDDALAPERAGQLGEPVVSGQDRSRRRATPRTRAGSRSARSAMVVSVTPAAVASAEQRSRHRCRPRRSRGGHRLRPAGPGRCASVRGVGVKSSIGELDGPEIEVRRVELISIPAGRASKASKPASTIRGQPGCVTGDRRDRRDVRLAAPAA